MQPNQFNHSIGHHLIVATTRMPTVVPSQAAAKVEVKGVKVIPDGGHKIGKKSSKRSED